MSSQSQKTALVSGNKGIGFAICQGLLDAGFDIFLAARDPDKGKAAIEKLSTDNNSVQLVELDVANDESIKNAVINVSNRTNSLDILVNNAGIYPDLRGS